ncbi:hypothetical protein AS188_08380 [Kocuria flava]|uniref:Integral membrane protein n=1 Tax=Kocuria flava TaxID=446860 RepID=A0A0U2WTP1_9MICC|nr:MULTISPECIES: hypothetical protein [Kocuria]ALU39764.1 hypothetical protein AS188_08380 [Kocuria flava]MCD1145096.1 hypothetical protein [Kocuria sp. LUK]MCJ8506020.1 hypothetical protein [Kocuria flava]PLC13100.1 hypothetical protein AUQ48_13840 [Kocuria flava]GEO93524.1 hypothetical protein KFL01_28300 [Kocuria flava]
MPGGWDWWFWTAAVLGAVSALVCTVQALRGRRPDDLTQGSVLLLEAFLLVYAAGSVLMHLLGPGPTGSALEYWGYLLTALLVPAGTFVWSLVERSSWSNWVLAAAGPVVVVMVYRMNVIWYYQ